MIIHEQGLYEDAVEGLAELLEITTKEASPMITDEILSEILDQMLETEADYIRQLANKIKETNEHNNINR